MGLAWAVVGVESMFFVIFISVSGCLASEGGGAVFFLLFLGSDFVEFSG